MKHRKLGKYSWWFEWNNHNYGFQVYKSRVVPGAFVIYLGRLLFFWCP